MLKLPIWIVTEHIQPSDPEGISLDESRKAMAFGSPDRILKFMSANRGGKWKTEGADDREGLVVLIADLHRLGVVNLTMNPENDGTGGEQFTLADLAALADSLK
jgi:hypothetical protein